MSKKKNPAPAAPEIVLEIAGEKIPVTWEEIPEELGALAQCLFENGGTPRIVMGLKVPPEQEWEVLLHEIFHAICDIYHVKFVLEDENVNDRREDNLCDIFGKGFSQALAPWLPKRPRKVRRTHAKGKPVEAGVGDDLNKLIENLETVKKGIGNAALKKV